MVNLHNDDKQFIKTNLKKYLEANDIVGCRKYLSSNFENIFRHYEWVHPARICYFLLDTLGEEVYFSHSTEIYDNEFRQLSITNFSIPDGIKKIGYRSFAFNVDLDNIEISDTVEVIGSEAFQQTNLSYVQLPNNLVKMGANVFYKSGLSEVDIPFKYVKKCQKDFNSDSVYQTVMDIKDMQIGVKNAKAAVY